MRCSGSFCIDRRLNRKKNMCLTGEIWLARVGNTLGWSRKFPRVSMRKKQALGILF